MPSKYFGWRWIGKYAEETPFHGISIALQGWNVYEYCSWLLMVVICVGVTVWQTVSLAQVYRSEPTSTSIQIHKNEISETSETFPQLTVCIQPPVTPHDEPGVGCIKILTE